MDELIKNSVYDAEITGYTSEGYGVTRINGRAVFVRGAISGEKCRVRILKSGKSAVYGMIEELLAPSPERMEPDCPVYRKCGGCAFRHMSYAEELRQKKQRVDDAFRRIGGLSLAAEDITGADETAGYRNKAIYSVGSSEHGAVTGFYRERSHDIVAVEKCLIESDFSSRAAAAVRRWMDESGVPAFDPAEGRGVRRVFCRFGLGTGEGQVVLVTGRGGLPHAGGLVSAVRQACPETASIMRCVNSRPGDTVLSSEFETVWGADRITDVLCGLRFSLSPGAFYQVNRAQAEKLYALALEFAAPDGNSDVLDLYCGTGTITLCLARAARSAVGVEVVESAVRDAAENAAANGIGNVRFICADAADAAEKLRSEGFAPAAVVVDPPRKGLAPEVPGIIASLSPERVVYVSCDPATLARDLKAFAPLGYSAVRARAVDIFPRCAHVETVVLMSRVKD